MHHAGVRHSLDGFHLEVVILACDSEFALFELVLTMVMSLEQ